MVVQVINDQIAVAVALLDNPMWEDKMLGKQTEEDCVLIRPARAVDCRSPPELISSLAPPEATIAPANRVTAWQKIRKW
ncbi:hypothetical protein V1477_014170 [Vespula maculifrons]|uniref:Uncharacterized protein n=1 Tax=Vespula maculifrons TaxID=7453 RepID=A0ABD2BKB4_VESMC